MDRVEGLDGRKLKEDVLKYCEANNMTMGAFATKAKVAESTISKLDKGGVSSRTVALVKQAMSNYRPKKYIMSIERDGVVKYCHSYSQEIALQTMYWQSADDDKMSVPYVFSSFKFAEALFWNWKNLTGNKGWHFNIREVKD